MPPTTRPNRPSKRQRGQSLLELALFLPILLILFSGLVEFGFLLNEYLNLMDGPREGARFGVDYDPWKDDGSSDNSAYYDTIAQTTLNTIDPIQLDINLETDDVVISVFKLNGTTVQSRHPTSGGVASVGGQWSLRYWCQHHYGSSDSTDFALALATAAECVPGTISGYQVSRFSDVEINTMIQGSGANSMGAVLVEIFYGYHQFLDLPWIKMFTPDPIPVSSYTIMPVPAAEPKETPTTAP